jgi:tripartite-type tricarboxylate transporter receptor subunit TctC
MKGNGMKGNILWNAEGAKMVQERKPAGSARAAQRALMSAGAIMGAVLLIGIMVAPLGAQTYPNKPIRLILPFPAGGATDILGRLIGTQLAERLGQSVVPENRPGAAGNIGIEAVAKSKPDGYTIGLTSPTIAISPSLYKKLNYDPIKDLAPISLVAQIPNLILIRPGLPVRNLREFVDYARANPGKLNYGTSGMGSSTHLATVLFTGLAKINMVNVQYKGSSQAMIGLMGGEVDLVVIGPPAALQHIQSGKVKPLAVLSDEHLPMLPNVPTIREAGVENAEVTTWYGLLAPAGTPRDIINRLNAEWIKIVAMPDMREKMKNAEVDPMSNTPDQFADFIKKETVRWARVIKEANISID